MGHVAPDGTLVLDQPDEIEAYRVLALRSALGLEIQGIRIRRGYSAYATIKREFGLHGSRPVVYRAFTQLLTDAGIYHPPQEEK